MVPFPDDISGKSVIVVGAGRSGRAAAALLARKDAHVILVDDNPDAIHPEQLEDVVASHLELVLGEVKPALVSRADAIVTSPGVALTHPLIAAARSSDLPIIGELELGSRFIQAPAVAVTGTNGKTTTVRWTAHLMGHGRARALLCGNVGTALSGVVDEEPDWFVLEVSSFQLETIERFRPRVAAVLNLAEDHGNRHPTLADYLASKARITVNQCREDALVLNADDPRVWSIAESTRAQVWGFSLRRVLERGVFTEKGELVIRAGPGERTQTLISTEEIALPGDHNLANALAAAAIAWVCGVGGAAIAAGLKDFPGVEHRLERTRRLRGVWFVNDSKATNVASLEVALKSFDQPIILIAGGRGKKDAPYERLAGLIASKVRHLLVFGEEAEVLERMWSAHVPTRRVADMEEAVRQAAGLARPGEVVLLSPACASFDMYRDYEERGRHFKDAVMRLE